MAGGAEAVAAAPVDTDSRGGRNKRMEEPSREFREIDSSGVGPESGVRRVSESLEANIYFRMSIIFNDLMDLSHFFFRMKWTLAIMYLILY